MVELDLNAVNEKSPYKVETYGRLGWYVFHTDHDIRYRAVFMEDDILHSDESYQFVIVNMDEKPSPSDKKVKTTIIELIKAFFDANNCVMLYICETGDGKQRSRNRLFNLHYSYSYDFSKQI